VCTRVKRASVAREVDRDFVSDEFDGAVEFALNANSLDGNRQSNVTKERDRFSSLLVAQRLRINEVIVTRVVNQSYQNGERCGNARVFV